MMHQLGRNYAGAINKKYGRSGTLWERRYRASLVETEAYLLEVYRYIDLNPVRAGMVGHAEVYRWSSARAHLGIESSALENHSVFEGLGMTVESRAAAYRSLLDEAVSVTIVETIRAALNTGQALGSEKFRNQIEALHLGRVRHLRPGRKPRRESQLACMQIAIAL